MFEIVDGRTDDGVTGILIAHLGAFGSGELINQKLFYTCQFFSLFRLRCDRTCLWASDKAKSRTSLLSYRDYLENCDFACSKFTYDTFQKANNYGADQSVQMRRLVCAIVVSNSPQKTAFLMSRPISCREYLKASFTTF